MVLEIGRDPEPSERNKAAIELFGEKLQEEDVVVYGSLELRGSQARWRDYGLTLDNMSLSNDWFFLEVSILLYEYMVLQ